MEAVVTAHLPLDREQRQALDKYMEEYDIKTRTALLDEALGEFMTKRHRKYPRTYGKTTGLKESR